MADSITSICCFSNKPIPSVALKQASLIIGALLQAEQEGLAGWPCPSTAPREALLGRAGQGRAAAGLGSPGGDGEKRRQPFQTALLGLWRSGSPPPIAFKEVLDFSIQSAAHDFLVVSTPDWPDGKTDMLHTRQGLQPSQSAPRRRTGL